MTSCQEQARNEYYKRVDAHKKLLDAAIKAGAPQKVIDDLQKLVNNPGNYA